VLLEDNQTMIIVYPKEHSRGEIVINRSKDAGLTIAQRKSILVNVGMPTFCNIFNFNF